MNFEFDDETKIMRDVARRLLERHATVARKMAWDTSAEGFDRDVWREITELGWLSFAAARDHEEITYLGVIADEIGRASYPSPFLHCVHGAMLLARSAAPRALMEEVMSGARLVGVLRPETLRGPITLDGGRLRGGDALLEWGASLDSVIVPLKAKGGYTLVLVDLSDGRVKRGAVETFDNGRSCVLSFDGVEIDGADLFHIGSDGWDQTAGLAELLFASEATGGANGAIALTVAYTRERKQFGHPIAAFQAVRHGLADVNALADGAWLATWDGLGTAGRGEKLGAKPALALWLSKRAFQEAVVKCSQYHGGMGHVVDSHMQFYYRRAGSFHGRVRSEWSLLGDIAAQYVTPHTLT